MKSTPNLRTFGISKEGLQGDQSKGNLRINYDSSSDCNIRNFDEREQFNDRKLLNEVIKESRREALEQVAKWFGAVAEFELDENTSIAFYSAHRACESMAQSGRIPGDGEYKKIGRRFLREHLQS